MFKRWIAALTSACLWAGGGALGQGVQDRSDKQTLNSVKLVTVLMALPAGAPLMSMRHDAFCIGRSEDKIWGGGRVAQDLPPYSAAFKREMEGAGYKVITPGEADLFDEHLGAADYEVAAVITDAHMNACSSSRGMLGRLLRGDDPLVSQNAVRGDGSMSVDWQLYSRVRNQVVVRVSTHGQSRLDQDVPGGAARLITEAFADNLHALAQNPEFRAGVNLPKPFTAGLQTPGRQSPIALAGSLKAGPRKIADATGSVVMITNDLGTGSGILVSSDGYILTNAHVVGDGTSARVRWSDGLETMAEVVRVARTRDVAIIKTNPRDRTPLAIKRGAVTPGARVFAIGTPRERAFQNTVSSGVISAERVIDGLRYIQSDVSISAGSSGGALLDESGSVIGITVSHYMNEGQPAGLNMFIPIGDALDFLALEQK